MRYWTIHSTTATLRSPVSISDSPLGALGAGPVLRPDPGGDVPKPNSILSWRCTGTLVTVSTPNGIFRCGPGSVVRT